MSYYLMEFDELVDMLRARDFEVARLKMQLEEANYIISTNKDDKFNRMYIEKWGIDTQKAITDFDKGVKELKQ